MEMPHNGQVMKVPCGPICAECTEIWDSHGKPSLDQFTHDLRNNQAMQEETNECRERIRARKAGTAEGAPEPLNDQNVRKTEETKIRISAGYWIYSLPEFTREYGMEARFVKGVRQLKLFSEDGLPEEIVLVRKNEPRSLEVVYQRSLQRHEDLCQAIIRAEQSEAVFANEAELFQADRPVALRMRRRLFNLNEDQIRNQVAEEQRKMQSEQHARGVAAIRNSGLSGSAGPARSVAPPVMSPGAATDPSLSSSGSSPTAAVAENPNAQAARRNLRDAAARACAVPAAGEPARSNASSRSVAGGTARSGRSEAGAAATAASERDASSALGLLIASCKAAAASHADLDEVMGVDDGEKLWDYIAMQQGVFDRKLHNGAGASAASIAVFSKGGHAPLLQCCRESIAFLSSKFCRLLSLVCILSFTRPLSLSRRFPPLA